MIEDGRATKYSTDALDNEQLLDFPRCYLQGVG